MRRSRDDWTTFIGKIELAMVLEEKFDVSLSDEELDAADTLGTLASLICRKQNCSGLSIEAVVEVATSYLVESGITSSDEVQKTSSLREMFSDDGRADANP